MKYIRFLNYYFIILINLFGYNLFLKCNEALDGRLSDAINHILEVAIKESKIDYTIVKQLYLNIEDSKKARIAANKIKKKFDKDVLKLERYPKMSNEQIKTKVQDLIKENNDLLDKAEIRCEIANK